MVQGKKLYLSIFDAPLHTLSMVLTWVPSSIVWMVKSISGTGFFSWMARMALSTCWVRRTSTGGVSSS